MRTRAADQHETDKQTEVPRMDFLNKSFAQLQGPVPVDDARARGSPPALLLAVVVISLGYLVTHQMSGADVYLMGGESFSPRDLQAMEAAFGKAELEATYDSKATRSAFPRPADASTWPPWPTATPCRPTSATSFSTPSTSGSSLRTARAHTTAAAQIAKQKELSLIIRSMKGIETAAVLYDEQDSTGGFRRRDDPDRLGQRPALRLRQP